MVLEKTRFLRRCVGVGCCLSGLLLLLGAKSEEGGSGEVADATAQDRATQSSPGTQVRLIRVPLPITGNTDIRVKQAVDQAVRRLLQEAEKKANSVIEARHPALERLIAALEELETLQRDQIEQCLGPPQPKNTIEVVQR